MRPKPSDLLFIIPQQPASELPVIDELTRKMTAAYREAVLSSYGTCGVHTCVCGAHSSNRDYFLPDGTRTNSLCVHYVAQHRSEVPRAQLSRIAEFGYGQADPEDEELQGGRCFENRVSEFFGKEILASFDSCDVDLRLAFRAAETAELGERQLVMGLLWKLRLTPDHIIREFSREFLKQSNGTLSKFKTTQSLNAAVIGPLIRLLGEADTDVRCWANHMIRNLADTDHEGVAMRLDEQGRIVERVEYKATGLSKDQTENTVAALVSILESERDAKMRGAILATLELLRNPP